MNYLRKIPFLNIIFLKMHENFVIHPSYSHLSAKLQDVIRNFSEKGEYITKGERNIIKMVHLEGASFNIKSFKTPNIIQSLVYQFLRKSKARRSFEYASKLRELGIKTPFPIAYSESFSLGLKESFYVSEHVDYDLDFRELIHNPKLEKRNEILKQFTEFTFRLHENGVNFLDHSPGNTMIVEGEENKFDFYLIDLNRMRFEPMDFERRMKNFRRLWLSKTMVKIMAEEYAKLYNKGFGETHALMLKHSTAFQKQINSKKVRRRR